MKGFPFQAAGLPALLNRMSNIHSTGRSFNVSACRTGPNRYLYQSVRIIGLAVGLPILQYHSALKLLAQIREDSRHLFIIPDIRTIGANQRNQLYRFVNADRPAISALCFIIREQIFQPLMYARSNSFRLWRLEIWIVWIDLTARNQDVNFASIQNAAASRFNIPSDPYRKRFKCPTMLLDKCTQILIADEYLSKALVKLGRKEHACVWQSLLSIP